MDGQEAKGLVGLLFDFDFSDFITTKLIKAMYMAGVVLIGLGSLSVLVTWFGQGGAAALVGLLLAPIGFLFGVAFLRVQLELVMVIFRIADNTSAMAGRVTTTPE